MCGVGFIMVFTRTTDGYACGRWRCATCDGKVRGGYGCGVRCGVRGGRPTGLEVGFGIGGTGVYVMSVSGDAGLNWGESG